MRSQYLTARDRLAERGLVEVRESVGSALVRLAFAVTGRSIEGEVNAAPFESVLARSSRGELLAGGDVVLERMAAGGAVATSGLNPGQSCTPSPGTPASPCARGRNL